MHIKVMNCNNIKHCEIDVDLGILNLIYGANGTGKSTIAYSLRDMINDSDVSKLRSLEHDGDPRVEIDGNINNVYIFNKEFIENVIFKEDSFILDQNEIFIEDNKVKKLKEKRDEKINEVLKILYNKEFIELKEAIETIQDDILIKGKTSRNNIESLDRNKKALKNITGGNPFEKIPKNTNLSKILNFQTDATQWARWWKTGKAYSFDNRCPFCGEYLNKSFDIEDLSTILNNLNIDARQKLLININIIKNNSNVKMNLFERFLNSKNKEIDKSTEKQTLKSIKDLQALNKYLSYFGVLKDGDVGVIENIIKEKTVLKKISNSSIRTQIETALQDIAVSNRIIQSINQGILRAIKNNLNKYEVFINDFFESAGINYHICVNDDSIFIKHKKSEEEITKLNYHLSYGERNSIALVLFCLIHFDNNKTDDIIIFDDPISSYDSEKRYAMMLLMFQKGTFKKALKNNYILMITHDLNTVIDLVRNGKPTNNINAVHMRNEQGLVVFKSLNKRSILIIRDNYREAMQSTDLLIVKLVYIRKLIELGYIKDKNRALYNYISSVEKHKAPSRKKGELLSDRSVNYAEKRIIKEIPYYTYKNLKTELELSNLFTLYESTNAWFEKLILFRTIHLKLEDKKITTKSCDENVFRFVTTTYHIDNDNLFDFDIGVFNPIPPYVEVMMTSYIDQLKNDLIVQGLI